MGELGLTGLPYPEHYGGAGLGTFAWALACEEIAAADMGMAVSLSVHVLSQLCILSSGTDEQKDRLLPPMTAGARLGAFALTEPGPAPMPPPSACARSATAMTTCSPARRSGSPTAATPTWSSCSAPSTARWARTGSPPSSSSDTPGFRVGSHERKMGIRDSVSAELVFDDARVPAANRLGEEGTGLKLALSARWGRGASASRRLRGAGTRRAGARGALRHPAHASSGAASPTRRWCRPCWPTPRRRWRRRAC